jgi:hypothetical protein
MDFSNFAGGFNDGNMPSQSKPCASSTTTEDFSWPLNTIDPSIFTSNSSSFDIPSEGTLSTPQLIGPHYSTYTSACNEEHQICQSLCQNQISQIACSGTCLQPLLPPRVESHQYSSTIEPQPNAISPPRPDPPPKRRGRPRIYPRPEEQGHIYTPNPHHTSSNREQNRLAAQRFRARHDAYLSDLNAQAAELTTKNRLLKTRVACLREEMLELRYDVLKHAECGCGVVERYVERNLGRMVKVGEDNGEWAKEGEIGGNEAEDEGEGEGSGGGGEGGV